MKHYNIQNYIRYKKDLEECIKRIPKKEFQDYTRSELTTTFLPLVENLARKFATSQQASGVMAITDLIQEGAINLIKAIDRIDWATIGASEDKEKTFKNFGKDKKMVAMFFNSIFLSIDAGNRDDEDMLYQIEDKSEPYNQEFLCIYLLSLLKQHLDDNEYDVLRLSYGLDCDKHSAKQIAEKLKINGSSAYVRVSQLKKQAVNKLIENVNHSQVIDYL